MARRRLAPAGAGDRPAAAAPATRPAMPPIAQVAGEAASEAALREVAETLRAAREEGRLVQNLPLGDIDAGHLARDRIEPRDTGFAELCESLREHGQRVPVELVALADGPRPYGLISGARRLAALRALHEATGEARFATVAALVRRPGSAAEAYAAMVEENEIRTGLSYYERARIVAITAGKGVFASEQEALRRLFGSASRPRRSKIGSFLAIYHELDPVLRWPFRISERLGLRIAARLQAGGADRLRSALARARPESPEAEIAALEAALRGPGPLREAAREEILPGLRLRLTGSGSRRVLTLSGPALDETLLARIRAALAAPGRDD